jgi:hypothetical protein
MRKKANPKVIGRVYELTIQLVQTPDTAYPDVTGDTTLVLDEVVQNWTQRVVDNVDSCFIVADVKTKVKELKGF